MNRNFPPRPAPRLLAALALSVLLAALVPSVGTAKNAKKSKCGDQVVADWYDDGRVGKIYPLQCYRDAIATLPTDVIDYSNAKQEISRALAYAREGKQDPGGKGTPQPTDSTPTSTTPAATTPANTAPANTAPARTTPADTTPSGTTPGSAIPAGTIPVDSVATAPTDTSGPSSVPVPLIVLGSVAVILIAAGSAGYLRRRSNGGDDDATPPASA